MVNNVALRFLGTTSQTNATRNYSSLLVKLDHHTVMVDCGESTQRQLQNRFIGGDEKLSNVRHILITHLHMDHVSGLVPLLCSMMGPSNTLAGSEKTARVEIFGPSGLRALLRTTLTLCYSTLSGYYTVHELLWPSQSVYPCESLTSARYRAADATILESSEPLVGASNGSLRSIPQVPLHENELPGRDVRLDEATVSWPHISLIDGVSITAAPILHRCPTVGYVFNESPSSSISATPEMLEALDANAEALAIRQKIRNPRSLLGKILKERKTVQLPDGTVLEPPPLDVLGRKVVVLGDTYDATAGIEATGGEGEGIDHSSKLPLRGMLALAQDADVLVHECTNAALPAALQPGNKKVNENRDAVKAKAKLRGHSTPQVAGQFAGRCGVRQLLLNHLGIKYFAPDPRFKQQHIFPRDSSSDYDPGRAVPSKADAEMSRRSRAIIDIERQATDAWHETLGARDTIHVKSAKARKAIAAYDGYLYRVEKIDVSQEAASSSPMEVMEQ
ncbi:hypothetical protein CBS101457_003982 [Exobasidium rhododendri]|nr:hypothetical protein CBS101457_003982 [Exobasidium rhododendri]